MSYTIVSVSAAETVNAVPPNAAKPACAAGLITILEEEIPKCVRGKEILSSYFIGSYYSTEVGIVDLYPCNYIIIG
jgi:hypothetical protein